MCRLRGPILARYHAEGGDVGELGRPTGGEQPALAQPARPFGADREAKFEHGTIYLDQRTGATAVIGHPG